MGFSYKKVLNFDEDGFYYLINDLVRFDVKDMLSGTIQKLYSRCTVFKREKLDENINIIIEDNHIQNKEEFLKEAKEKIEEAIEICFKKALKEKFNNKIKFDFQIEDCNTEKINKIKNFCDYLKQIGVESIDICIVHNANDFSVEEINNLLNLQDYLKETWGIEDLKVADIEKLEYGEKVSKDVRGNDEVSYTKRYSLSRTLEAHKLMEDELKKIENLNLSPFEKFLFAHDFVANRIYKEEKGEINFHESRDFIAAMTGDYIVCVGYAAILKRFCERLGIECVKISGYSNGDGHAANIVKIVDEKYGINGEYFCDACWDSRRFDEEGNEEVDGTRRYFNAALPLQDVQHIAQSGFFAEKLKDKESKAIPITTFENALASLYIKLEGKNFNWKNIDKGIGRSYGQSGNDLGDNAFIEGVRLANRYDDFKDNIAKVDNIENNNLGKEEWEFILNRLNETTTDEYKELAEKILYLLDELNGRNLENLIKMLNKNFEFKGNAMDHYEFTCNNKLALIYVIVKEKLVKKQREIEANIQQGKEERQEQKTIQQEKKKKQQQAQKEETGLGI